MSLAPVHQYQPGEVLTAANLQASVEQPLLNPIGLISPTSGAINFNNQYHTNLRLENLAADPTPGSTGRVFWNTSLKQAEVDDGTVIRALPSLISSAASTSGGDLIVSASSGASWSLLPVGTVGNVLTATTTGPHWAAIATPPAFDPESAAVFYEDFFSQDAVGFSVTGNRHWVNNFFAFGGPGAMLQRENLSGGVIKLVTNSGNPGSVTLGPTRVMSSESKPFSVPQHFTFQARCMNATTSGSSTVSGVVGVADTNFETSALTNGIYFVIPNTTGEILGQTAAGGVYSTIAMGVAPNAFHKLKYSVVSSVRVDFYADAALVGSITTNIPDLTVQMGTGFGVANGANLEGLNVDYLHIISTR